MIQMTIFGCGAAGNKAAITAVETGVIPADHIRLLNTTSKDIPEQYANDPNMFVPFTSGLGGCGKESSKGREAIFQAIKDKKIDLAALINDDAKEVALVSSVEGGTGSGAIPVIAHLFNNMNIPVHVFAFVGFQDEARGINNTLKFFKSLPENVILHTIKNAHFLDYSKNYGKAEQLANEEFAREIEILSGQKIIPSRHNIDDTDLYKLNVQPGYATIMHVSLNGIKNTEGFNAAVAQAFENACFMDNDTSAKRIGVMINATKRVQDAVDNSFEVIKRYVGIPIETFQHIQPDKDEDFIGSEEYIDIIACGMNYPEKPIVDIGAKYKDIKGRLNTTRKGFGEIFSNMDLGSDDDDLNAFDVDIKNRGTFDAAMQQLFEKVSGATTSSGKNVPLGSPIANPANNPMSNGAVLLD